MKTYKLNDLNNPLISVLMPAYNAEKYIKEAIESILNQTFSNFEFIIIDDGSIDATEEIIKSFKDSCIVYIKNEKNLGLIKTLNKGISIARGEFIARMDSDDISMPQRFELQLDVFKKYKGVDIVNVALKKMSEDGTKLSKYRHNIYPGFEAIHYLINIDTFIVHPGVLVKACLLKKYRYRDCEECIYVEDTDLWMRMINDGCICYTIKTPLLLYRSANLAGISNTHSKIQRQRTIDLHSTCLSKNVHFHFSPIVLSLLHGDKDFITLKNLYNTNKELIRFCRYLRLKNNLSKDAVRDINSWALRKKIVLMYYFLQNFLVKIFIWLSRVNIFINDGIRKNEKTSGV